MSSCRSWKPQEKYIYIYFDCLTCDHRKDYPDCAENKRQFRDCDSSVTSKNEGDEWMGQLSVDIIFSRSFMKLFERYIEAIEEQNEIMKNNTVTNKEDETKWMFGGGFQESGGCG